MAFQVRSTIDPTHAADKWERKVEAAGSDLLDGYSHPRRDPQAHSDISANTWAANTAAAKARYQAQLAAYDTAAAIDAMKNYGVNRYTDSGRTKKRKVIAFHQAYHGTVEAGMAALPADRSSYSARQARSKAMQDYLHAHPYKKSS